MRLGDEAALFVKPVAKWFAEDMYSTDCFKTAWWMTIMLLAVAVVKA